MSISKRGNTWWIHFTTPDGERVRQSARTTDKNAAQELHDQLKAEAWRVAQLGERRHYTWDEAALRYLQRYPDRNKAAHIRRFTAFFRGKRLGELKPEQDIMPALRGLAVPYSTNRHIATLRHLLRLARDEWNWIDRVPLIKPLPEPKRRNDFLTPPEALALVNALAERHRDLVRFALATGLRLGNILALEWTQIDLDRRAAWIHADQAKGRRAIAVPLNAQALAILRARAQQPRPFDQGRIDTRVWKKALKAAGITRRVRFHDLRHTWASWHVQQGTPLLALQELGGWQSSEMVRRYAHLGTHHLAAHAENIATQLRHTPSDCALKESAAIH